MDVNEWISVKSKQRTLKKDEIIVPTMKIDPIVLQSLIYARLCRNISQEEADFLCGFPRSTFKNIDSNRYIPNEGQLQSIYNVFNIQLKINKLF